MEMKFIEIVGVVAGTVQTYLSETDGAERNKLSEFLSNFYAGSQYNNLLTNESLVTLSNQVHGNAVYQTFVYDVQLMVIGVVGRDDFEAVIDRLAYAVAAKVVYADPLPATWYVGPTDDDRFNITNEDLAKRIRANRWVVAMLLLAWAEIPEFNHGTHQGTA